MAGFGRFFQNLNRVFPSSGTVGVQPSEVTDSVQLVSELMRPTWAQGMVLVRIAQSFVTAGVNIGTNIGEPPVGYITLPIYISAVQDGLNPLTVELRLDGTVDVQDYPGSWARGVSTARLFSVVLNQNIPGKLRFSVPIFHTDRYNITFISSLVPAGVNIDLTALIVWIPLDLLNVEFWRSASE